MNLPGTGRRNEPGAGTGGPLREWIRRRNRCRLDALNHAAPRPTIVARVIFPLEAYDHLACGGAKSLLRQPAVAGWNPLRDLLRGRADFEPHPAAAGVDVRT